MLASASTSVGARTASSAAPSAIDEPPAKAAGASRQRRQECRENPDHRWLR